TYAPDRMPSIPSSRTASSCVIKLWPKSVRSPPGTTHFSVRPENAPAGPRGMSGGSPVLERPHPPESCGSAIAKVLPQQESLDFPRHGFRQFTAESHFTGHFVGRQSCFHALTNLGRQGIRTSAWFAQPHTSDRVGEPLFVRRAHYRRLRDASMAQEHVFDFYRGDPHPGDFQHVVGSPAVVEIAIRIAHKLVAGHDPFES